MSCPGMRKEDCPKEKARLAKLKKAEIGEKIPTEDPEVYYHNGIKFIIKSQKANGG